MSIAVELPDVAAGTNSDAVRIQWIVGAVTNGTSMPIVLRAPLRLAASSFRRDIRVRRVIRSRSCARA